MLEVGKEGLTSKAGLAGVWIEAAWAGGLSVNSRDWVVVSLRLKGSSFEVTSRQLLRLDVRGLGAVGCV